MRLSTSDGTLFAIFAVSQSARPALSVLPKNPPNPAGNRHFELTVGVFPLVQIQASTKVPQGRDF